MFLTLLLLSIHIIVPAINGFPYHANSSAANGCPYPTEQFKCKRGPCVKVSWVCDGDFDCADGSDEASYLCGDYSEDGLPGLVFVMDISRRQMEYELESVVDISLEVLDAITRHEKMFEDFKFIAFTSEAVWPPQSSKDLVQFRSFLRNMSTSNVSKYNEEPKVLSAIQEALEVAAPKSKIFVFTEWSNKDGALLMPNITSLLRSKQSQVIIFLTSFAEPSKEYRKIASVSKGQVLNVHWGSLKRFQEFIEWMAQPHLQNLLAVDYLLNTSYSHNMKNYSCSISNDITDLIFTMNAFENRNYGTVEPEISFTDENGNVIRPISITSSRRTHIYRIKKPKFKLLVIGVEDRDSPYTIRVTGGIKVDVNFTYGFSVSGTWNSFMSEFSQFPFPGQTNYLFAKPSSALSPSSEHVIPLFSELKSYPNHTFIHRVNLKVLRRSTDGTYVGSYTASDLTYESFYLRVRGLTSSGSFFDKIISSPMRPSSQANVIIISESETAQTSNSISPVTLHCYVESASPYFVFWTKNESFLRSSSSYYTEEICDHTVQLSSTDSRNGDNSYRCSILRSFEENSLAKSRAIRLHVTNSTPPDFSSITSAMTNLSVAPETDNNGLNDDRDKTSSRSVPSTSKTTRNSSTRRQTILFSILLVILFLVLGFGIFTRKKYFERRANRVQVVDLHSF